MDPLNDDNTQVVDETTEETVAPETEDAVAEEETTEDETESEE